MAILGVAVLAAPFQLERGRAGPARVLGAACGIALRAVLAVMLRHVLKAGSRDRRFVGKGIGSRALMLVPAACVAMPLLWARKRRIPYPFWMDDLFLSIVALDLAGNVFDLYDGYEHFDLIPHAHGTGSLTVLIAWLLAFLVPWFWLRVRREAASRRARLAADLLLAMLALQIALGIATLLLAVPVALAGAHQARALLVFGSALLAAHSLR